MHPIRTTILAMLATASIAFAQEAPQAPQLTLPQAVAQALEHNFDLRIQRYEPGIANDNVDIEKSAFDMQLTASTSVGKDKDAYTGIDTDTATTSTGVTKKISTGATVGLETTLDHNYTTALRDDSGIYATFTQPLLKGAWADVTLAELHKAKSKLSATQMQTRSNALDLVRDVAEKYWGLSYARENLALSKTAVEAAQKLVEETDAKVKAGLASDIDLLQAQATLSEKRQALTQAQLDLSQSGDELATLMGSLLEQTGTSYTPAVSALPVDFAHAPSFEEIWPRILSEDLATTMQEEAVRQADIDRIVAVSDRKPQLDLTLKTGVAGSDNDERGSYDSLSDRDGHSWNTALAFSMPLGNRVNIAKARQAGSRLEQAKIQLISIKQTLYKEARQAWRDVELGLDRCASTTAAVQYQSQALERARAKYSRQLISFRELLDAQTDYDTAQQNRIVALRDLAVARTVMARLEGTLPKIIDFDSSSSIPTVDKPSK